MKNKIVIFSNIKGGVGKTTLCALFADYLIEHGFPTFVIDADLQASLFRHQQREKDAAPDAQIPWNVDMLDTSDRKRLVQVMEKLKEVPGVVLIDCPGNLNDRNLAYIYQSADTAIIPGCHRHIRQGIEVNFVCQSDFRSQPDQCGGKKV